MAMMDNQAFLISHIRNSFITSDDTGMCELILEGEEQHRERPHSGLEKRPTTWHGKGSTEDVSFSPTSESSGGLMCDSDTELSHSVDIVPDMDFTSHRRRSNTAQRLEKLKRERHQKSKVRHIPWKRGDAAVSEISEYFEKKPVGLGAVSKESRDGKDGTDGGKKRKSMLSLLLDQMGPSNHNPFADYSKFDGKSSGGVNTKKVGIFLTMAAPEQRVYPMSVTTLGTAKVEDIIGLICWQYCNENRLPLLQESVDCYALHIAEDDGEVDLDFPALDVREPISKFGFTRLALVERAVPRRHMSNMVVTINLPDRGFSRIPIDDTSVLMRELLEKLLARRKLNQIAGLEYRLEKQNEPGTVIDLDKSLSQMTTFEFCLVRENSARGDVDSEESFEDMSDMAASLSSHQYKCYHVTLLQKIGRSIEVQLGVSGEKVEVDPVQVKGFLPFKQKASSYDIEDIASCVLMEHGKPIGKSRVRLVYSKPHNEFKHLDFEGTSAVAKEIVMKINNIMELRSSPKKTEYLLRKEKGNILNKLKRQTIG